MRRVVDNDILTMISRLIVGAVFIYAAYYKIVDPASFAKSIWFYHIMPGNLINALAIVLPMLELLCGLGLILGIFYRGSVLWMNLMMVVFMIAISTAIYRGISIDCGCFKASAASSESAWDTLLRDGLLLGMTIQMLFSRSRKWMLCEN